MKKHKIQHKFIQELQNAPIVQAACDKLGVSRNCYYRWLKKDPAFAREAEQALSQGEARVNDIAESVVLRGIQKQEWVPTKYWLDHRHEKFKKGTEWKNSERPPVRFDHTKRKEMLKKWFRQPPSVTEEPKAT